MDGWMDGTAIKLPLIRLSGNEPPLRTSAHTRIYLFTRSRRGKFINRPIVDGTATRSHVQRPIVTEIQDGSF